MPKAYSGFDADEDEKFVDQLKSSKVRSSRQARSDRSRTGKNPRRPVSFSEMSREEATQVRELTGSRDNWLGMTSY